MSIFFLLGSSAGGLLGSGFSQKTAPSQKLGNQWQKSSKPQATSWQSQTKSSTAAKPNYTVNFSVIGGREERGVRAPSFGKFFEYVLLIMSHVKLVGCVVTCRSSSTFIFFFTFKLCLVENRKTLAKSGVLPFQTYPST